MCQTLFLPNVQIYESISLGILPSGSVQTVPTAVMEKQDQLVVHCP